MRSEPPTPTRAPDNQIRKTQDQLKYIRHTRLLVSRVGGSYSIGDISLKVCVIPSWWQLPDTLNAASPILCRLRAEGLASGLELINNLEFQWIEFKLINDKIILWWTMPG